MASSSSLSSSSSSEDATQKPNIPSHFVSNCLLSSAFLRTPFTPPFFRHTIKPPNPDSFRDLHKSISSVFDQCFRTVNSIADQNPLLQKLFSLPDNLRNVFQIRFRNHSTVNSLSMHNFAAILPGDSVAGIVAANGVLNFLNIYNTLLIVRLVLTWFPNSPAAIVSPLSTICDPYLNIFRGIIPPLGGTLDLSPILAFLVLNAITSTASALPAEMPVEGPSPQRSSSAPHLFNLTMAQKQWMKRVCGEKSKNSPSVD
ncbi:hypothetical protein IFM89_019825 [Coptis chinensis]|uniref:Uncharacterized protein n=1 Tax=Coptis chinensis TaxID=261450 RepID=A0A835IE12_9MAGN|nr:hypothetical protein IFM89_019825 [Coptis chinensis]